MLKPSLKVSSKTIRANIKISSKNNLKRKEKMNESLVFNSILSLKSIVNNQFSFLAQSVK